MVVGETSTVKRGNHGFGRSVLLHAYHFAGEHHDVGDVLVNIFGHASQVSWLRLHWLSVLLLRCGARLLGRLHGKLHRHHARIGVFHWIASHLDRYGLWAVHGFLAHGMRRARRATPRTANRACRRVRHRELGCLRIYAIRQHAPLRVLRHAHALSALDNGLHRGSIYGTKRRAARTHVAPSHWVCWRARAGSRRAYRKRPLPVLYRPRVGRIGRSTVFSRTQLRGKRPYAMDGGIYWRFLL